ncbi:hypothetical protein BKA93DRAFT_859071 [Sparassis latifolia]
MTTYRAAISENSSASCTIDNVSPSTQSVTPARVPSKNGSLHTLELDRVAGSLLQRNDCLPAVDAKAATGEIGLTAPAILLKDYLAIRTSQHMLNSTLAVLLHYIKLGVRNDPYPPGMVMVVDDSSVNSQDSCNTTVPHIVDLERGLSSHKRWELPSLATWSSVELEDAICSVVDDKGIAQAATDGAAATMKFSPNVRRPARAYKIYYGKLRRQPPRWAPACPPSTKGSGPERIDVVHSWLLQQTYELR